MWSLPVMTWRGIIISATSLRAWLGLMAYDNHDYGRWLPDYWAMLFSMTDEEISFFNDHLAQSMTGLPNSCQPLDLWIETAKNLNSKLKQGWLQLLHNEKQLFFNNKECEQRHMREGHSESKSQQSASSQETRRVPASKNEKG